MRWPIGLNRWRHTLQEGLPALQFVVEGGLECGIARRLAGHIADYELGVTPSEIAPADDLAAARRASVSARCFASGSSLQL